MESQYALMSFGIPVKSLQVNSDGDLKRAPHLKWLTLRKRTEQMVRDSNGTMKQIVVPSRMDVLFGRGTPLQSHVGNMRLIDLIEEDLEKYFSSSKKAGKAAVVNSLIKTINNEGGRFLKQSRDGVWEEVDDSSAFDKVGHGFRNHKPPTRPLEKAPAEKRSSISSKTANTNPTGLPPAGDSKPEN